MLTLPLAGVMGAACWALAHAIDGLAGVLVVSALLLIATAYMYARSRRNPIDKTNVTQDWDPSLDPAQQQTRNH